MGELNSLTKAVQSKYLGINLDSAEQGEDLEAKIQRAYKEMQRLISLREARKNMASTQALTISEEWQHMSLPVVYPEFDGVKVSSAKDEFILRTRGIAMQWVYNGGEPFYISHPHLAYIMTFSPEGWCNFKNVGVPVDNGDIKMSACTHPHAHGGSASRFSDVCTGPHNPFIRNLTQRNGIKSMVDFKSSMTWALRWMRTYNVNDSYSPDVYTGSVPTIGRLASNATRELWAGETEKVIKAGVAKALMDTYRYLQDPSREMLSDESTQFLTDLIGNFKDESDNGDCLYGIKSQIVAACALSKGDWEDPTLRLIEGTIATEFDLERNTEHALVQDHFSNITDEYEEELIPRLSMYLHVLCTFQALYQCVVLMAMEDESWSLGTSSPARSLLTRDILDSAFNQTGMVHAYARRILKTLRAKRFKGEIKCEKVLEEYTHLLDNLFSVTQTHTLESSRKGSWLGYLYKEYKSRKSAN